MYISNSSLLPPDFTAETMMHSHRSMPLNPEIADVFYRAGYIERWGRGIQKICDACREHGADEPVYTVQSNYVMVKFAALESAIVRDSKVPKVQSEPLDEPLENLLEKRILENIKKNPRVTYDELAARFGNVAQFNKKRNRQDECRWFDRTCWGQKIWALEDFRIAYMNHSKGRKNNE